MKHNFTISNGDRACEITILVVALILALLLAIPVSAAGDRKTYVLNGIQDNIFVSVGGGANAVADNGSFCVGGPAVEACVGKWLTPTWAVRAGWRGITNKAADSTNGWFAADNTFGYNYFNGSVMWDATRTFAGYRADRLLSVLPYVHAGIVNTSYAGAVTNEFAGGPGIAARVRLTRRLALYADVQATYAREEAWRQAGKLICFPSATAGITVQVGRRTDFRTEETRTVELVKTVEIDRTNYDRIAELEAALKAAMNRKADTVKVRELFALPEIIYFDLDKAAVSQREAAHLEYFVMNLPEGASITLAGHADRETGNPRHNKGLSQRRVNAVTDVLRALGFKGQILGEAFGDTSNFMNAPYKNRCVTIKVNLD